VKDKCSSLAHLTNGCSDMTAAGAMIRTGYRDLAQRETIQELLTLLQESEDVWLAMDHLEKEMAAVGATDSFWAISAFRRFWDKRTVHKMSEAFEKDARAHLLHVQKTSTKARGNHVRRKVNFDSVQTSNDATSPTSSTQASASVAGASQDGNRDDASTVSANSSITSDASAEEDTDDQAQLLSEAEGVSDLRSPFGDESESHSLRTLRGRSRL